MGRPNKGLTSGYALRMTERERSIVECVQRVHKEAGIPVSLNDALRILIRRGALPLPTDLPTARRAIQTHVTDCPYCTPDHIGCPDGHAYRAAYHRTVPPPINPLFKEPT